MQVLSIGDIDAPTGKLAPCDGGKRVKKRDRQDGHWHAQGHRGRSLQRAVNTQNPYHQTDEHTMQSVSKTVTSVTLGVAITRKDFTAAPMFCSAEICR